MIGPDQEYIFTRKEYNKPRNESPLKAPVVDDAAILQGISDKYGLEQ